jgi:DEAD/DEAH box helicase domain-containing protein
MTADLVGKTRDLIAGCPCGSGCPSCVGPLGETGPRAKAVALDILSRLPAVALPGAPEDPFPGPEWA